MRPAWRAAALAALVGAGPTVLSGQARPARAAAPTWPVTAAPGDWVLPTRDYAATRFSPLDQITAQNVHQLKPVWSFSTGLLRAHEGNPLVVDGVMFVHTPFPNAVFALDLTKPGAPILWRYAVPASIARLTPAAGCCDVGSKGIGYHPSGKLYVPVFSGDLAALDARTGREIWRVRNVDSKVGGSMPGPPLVVKDLVIVGSGGAEYGVRGHLTAYDAATGRLVWRGYHTGPDAEVLLDTDANIQYSSHRGPDLGVKSWPADEWKRGGATASGWLSYDPELDLVYYGTDHPGTYHAATRPGDNKWSNTLFARSATTGKVKWALQLTPHDEWGFDASNENILADLQIQGAPVKALVHFDRNGFAYTVDRVTGRLLLAERYGPANWASRIDAGSAVPLRDPRFAQSATTTTGICPAAPGEKGSNPAAFAPAAGLFFVPVNNLCMDLTPAPAAYVAGRPYLGATFKLSPGPGGNRGRFIAWDATTGSIAWQIQEPYAVTGGALATAGGLVLYGTMDGWLKAVDQKSGQELWRYKTPSGIVGSPIAFSGPDGREYIAILSGLGGWLGQPNNGAFPGLAQISNQGGTLTVFGL
jgi:PQQ-dependent dehydrogenase (methanol/ethanol family)